MQTFSSVPWLRITGLNSSKKVWCYGWHRTYDRLILCASLSQVFSGLRLINSKKIACCIEHKHNWLSLVNYWELASPQYWGTLSKSGCPQRVLGSWGLQWDSQAVPMLEFMPTLDKGNLKPWCHSTRKALWPRVEAHWEMCCRVKFGLKSSFWNNLLSVLSGPHCLRKLGKILPIG